MSATYKPIPENAEQYRQALAVLKTADALQTQMKNAYFFSPPVHAASRRSYENNHSQDCEIYFTVVNGRNQPIEFTILVSQETKCSRNIVYYKSSVSINGKGSNFKALRNWIERLELFVSPTQAGSQYHEEILDLEGL